MSYSGTQYLIYRGKEYLVYGWNKRRGLAELDARFYNTGNPNRHAIVVPNWELSRHPIIQSKEGHYYILSRSRK